MQNYVFYKKIIKVLLQTLKGYVIDEKWEINWYVLLKMARHNLHKSALINYGYVFPCSGKLSLYLWPFD